MVGNLTRVHSLLSTSVVWHGQKTLDDTAQRLLCFSIPHLCIKNALLGFEQALAFEGFPRKFGVELLGLKTNWGHG